MPVQQTTYYPVPAATGQRLMRGACGRAGRRERLAGGPSPSLQEKRGIVFFVEFGVANNNRRFDSA